LLDVARSISLGNWGQIPGASLSREQQAATTLRGTLDRVAGAKVSFAGSGEERPPIVERAAGWNG
jgi:hypothetical protein